MNAQPHPQAPVDLHLTCKRHRLPVPMVCLGIQPSPRGGLMAIFGCAHPACPFRQGWAFDHTGCAFPVWFGIAGRQRPARFSHSPTQRSTTTMPRLSDLTTLFHRTRSTDPATDLTPSEAHAPARRPRRLISLVGYHHAGLVLVEPTRPFDPEFTHTLDQLELGLGSSPNLTEGLRTALAQHHTMPASELDARVIWLISSGHPEPWNATPGRLLEACLNAGITLHTVAVGFPDDPLTLAELANATPGGEAHWVEDSASLARILATTPPRHPTASVIALDCSDAMLMPVGHHTRMSLAVDGLRRYLRHLTRRYL